MKHNNIGLYVGCTGILVNFLILHEFLHALFFKQDNANIKNNPNTVAKIVDQKLTPTIANDHVTPIEKYKKLCNEKNLLTLVLKQCWAGNSKTAGF